MTEAIMMPIPKKYKNGVAAYNTVEEARAFAEELTKETGYAHNVVIDDKAGCAIVENTGKYLGDPTLSFTGYQDSAACLKDIWEDDCRYLNEQERIGSASLSDDNKLMPVDWASYTHRIVRSNGRESAAAFVRKLKKIVDSESERQGRHLNAFALRNAEDESLFLLVMYPSGLDDIEGNPIYEGEVLYRQDNSSITVNKISKFTFSSFERDLGKRAVFIDDTIDSLGLGAIYIQTFCETEDCRFYDGFQRLKKTLWSNKDRRKYKDYISLLDAIGIICGTALVLVGGFFIAAYLFR